MFGSKKKREMQEKRDAAILARHLDALNNTYADFKARYDAAVKLDDVALRYLTYKELACEVSNSVNAVNDNLYDRRAMKNVDGTKLATLGGGLATIFSGMAMLEPHNLVVGFGVMTAGMFGSLASSYYIDRRATKILSTYQKAQQDRENFFKASNDILKELNNEIYALPGRDPAGFAASPYFNRVVEAEPELLKTFNRAASKIAAKHAPKAKHNKRPEV